MSTLAELSFDFIWLLLFGKEDQITVDYAVRWQESLPDYFARLTAQEKDALSAVAANARSRLLAEPDQYGYTPRKLVSAQQKEFLDLVASGKFFKQFEELP